MMGVGTNSLGYGNKNIDRSVIKKIKLGNMSSLNAPEEVYLSKNYWNSIRGPINADTQGQEQKQMQSQLDLQEL